MRSPSTRSFARRGFTLIEAAIVTAIVGIGVVAMLELLAAGSMANGDSTELTTAMGLANNIHERMMSTPYADVFTTFDNHSYSPPIDANNNVISEMSNWNQQVNVSYVDPNNITFGVPDTQVEPTSQITVTVNHNNRLVYQMTWLSAASEWTAP